MDERPTTLWPWLALVSLGLVCGVIYGALRAEGPVRIAIVRTIAARDLDSERALREFVAALRDTIAEVAAARPRSVALVPPWQALCEGGGPCAGRVADVYLVVSTERLEDAGAGLRVVFASRARSHPDSITLAIPDRQPWRWQPFVQRTIARLGLGDDASDGDGGGPFEADEGTELLRAALTGTTVELTKPDLTAVPSSGWMSWLRPPRVEAVPPGIREFLDEYAAAWTSRASGRVRALHTTMSSGQRADIEHYFAYAAELDVGFSDLEVMSRGDEALVSAWRVDRATVADGGPLALRTRVDLLLRRLGGEWMVVDQSRPRELVWASLPRPTVSTDSWRARDVPRSIPAAVLVPPPVDTRLKSVPRWVVSTADDRAPLRRGLTIAEIETLVAGGDTSRRIRATTQPPWVVMNELAGRDDHHLAQRLNGLYQDVVRDFPFLPKPSNPAVLIVFESKERNDRFWEALEARLQVRSAGLPPGARGEATLGIGTTWWSEDIDDGSMTRLCVHEAVHALMAQMLDVGNRTESWFAEGLASRYELGAVDFDVGAAVRKAVQESRFPSVPELMSAEKIPPHGYVPAALLIEWLLADPLRRSQFPVLNRELHAAPSQPLAPLLERNFGMSIARLDEQWRAWVADRYGGIP